MITLPPSVTLKSWLSLGNQDTTLLRSMENELFRRITLTGRSLDVGGGKGFSYVEDLTIGGRLDSINIGEALQPTYVADLNDALPISDGVYDNVICFNTLEHVYDEQKLLAEIFRVLVPGGRFIITVPFFYKRHGVYGDFHRHTAEYWEQALIKQGVSSKAFVIQPLVWCPLSSALASLPGFKGGRRGRASKLSVLAIELCRNLLVGHDRVRQTYKDWALGFYIDGTKTLTDAVGDNEKS